MLTIFSFATMEIESVVYMMSDVASRLYALEFDNRPSTLIQCTSSNGSVDSEQYLLYLQKQHKISILERNLIDERLLDREREGVPKQRQKKRRSVKSLVPITLIKMVILCTWSHERPCGIIFTSPALL
jgi:hypothetical protein